MDKNLAILIGRVGQDPKVHTTQSGRVKLMFRMATGERWKGKDGERQERTDWHSVVVWGKQAEVLEPMIRKGSLVWVEGKIQNRDYEKDGQKRTITEIVADQVGLLDRVGAGERRTSSVSRHDGPVANVGQDDFDDIPF